MKVSATAKGFDGLAVRVPGDVFDMPDGSKARWFVTVAEGDEFTEDDIRAEVQKIVDARAATLLAADRVSAIANLAVLRTVSSGINSALTQAEERKVAADNAVRDAKTQSDSASNFAERDAAAVAVAKANSGLIAADASVAAAQESKTVFMNENYPARSPNRGASFNEPGRVKPRG